MKDTRRCCRRDLFMTKAPDKHSGNCCNSINLIRLFLRKSYKSGIPLNISNWKLNLISMNLNPFDKAMETPWKHSRELGAIETSILNCTRNKSQQWISYKRKFCSALHNKWVMTRTKNWSQIVQSKIMALCVLFYLLKNKIDFI